MLAVSFKVGGGENFPGIPGACATRNFMYLVRGPCRVPKVTEQATQAIQAIIGPTEFIKAYMRQSASVS